MSSSLLSLSGQVDPHELIPEDWTCDQLGSACEVFGGGKLGLTKENYQGTGVTAFSAAGPDGFVEIAEITDRAGVVLSAIGANCGRCFFASGNWTTLANVQSIIPKDGLDARFLYYFVNRDGYWDRSGSAQPFIKPRSVHVSWVAYPTAEAEQSKIAEVLSTVDRAIEQTETLIAKQQRIKTGLLRDLVTRGIDEHGNLRSEQTHKFKDSPIGQIPAEWGTLRLDQMTRPDSPITYGVVQPGRPDDNGVRFVRGGDIYDGIVRVEQLRTISKTISATYKRTVLEGGELVMSLVGYPGEVAVIPTSLAGANIARQAALVRLASVHDARFVMFYLMSIPGKRQVFGSTLGSAQQVVNLKDLRTVIVPRPSPAEERAIRERVDAVYDEIGAQVRSLKKLLQLKRGLIQDLLTGKRRVTALLEQREERNMSSRNRNGGHTDVAP